MARDTDVRPSGGEARSAEGDGADWAVLALAPLALAAMMLIAAAAFAEGTEDPAAAAGQNTATEESAPDQTDCVAAGGETVEGMPATKHQEQVLKTDEYDPVDHGRRQVRSRAGQAQHGKIQGSAVA